jgi:hypothetical protein
MTIQQQLRGWGMDVEALKGEGAFLFLDEVATRIFDEGLK